MKHEMAPTIIMRPKKYPMKYVSSIHATTADDNLSQNDPKNCRWTETGVYADDRLSKEYDHRQGCEQSHFVAGTELNAEHDKALL
jgi:hypothetical protein